MVLRSRLIFLMIYLLLIGLTACGGVGNATTPLPPLTLAPLPTPFIMGNCNITSDLETWVQMADLRVRQFNEMIDAASEKSRDQLWIVATEMRDVSLSMSLAGTPDCTEQAQEEVIQAMELTTQLFQHYVNEQDTDLQQIIRDSRASFVNTTQLLNELKRTLEERYTNTD